MAPPPAGAPYQSHATLADAAVAFCRLLRQRGVTLGIGEVTDATRALGIAHLSPEGHRAALRAATAKSAPDLATFERCYDEYWCGAPAPAERRDTDGDGGTGTALARRARSAGEQTDADEPAADAATGTYSHERSLAERNFAVAAEDEVADIAILLQRLGRLLARALSRRYRAQTRGRLPDLRRTMRLMLRDGEILEIAQRQRRPRRLELDLICDVSKSMDVYSSFLIQFMYAFQHAYRRIETYVFSTSLHRITPLLKEPALQLALSRARDTVPDWSGGTRIGESLQRYLADYGSRLGRRTVVVILSDGWDTGDTELLAGAMRSIHKRAARVLWLNPLLGSPGYRPQTRGMLAALPYIDVFAAGHSLDALQRLPRQLLV